MTTLFNIKRVLAEEVMSGEESKQVYIFCNICKENVSLNVEDIDFEKTKTGIASILSVHGEPNHAVLVYLDAKFKIRGTEYPAYLQIAEAASKNIESDIQEEEEITQDLREIISAFGDKESSAIAAFAQIIAQLIIGNFIYLVHNNKSIANVVKSQLDTLFAKQRTSLFVLSYDEIDNVSGMRPTIFDLQMETFISEGMQVDTTYFEYIVAEALGETNGFSLLQNEYSKLMYSYKRLWELLSSGARTYTPTKLAYLVSIDESLIPLLLQMAGNDGVDVKSRVNDS
jgi:hypothetical protein